MPDPLLICTDLDRTLLPNGPQPESPGARGYFSRLAAHPEVTLAYVTGRHLSLVEKAITNYALPQPHFAITDVGTMIHEHDPGGWHVWQHWETEIDQDWRECSHQDLRRLFQDLHSLRLQESTKQNRHKLSYYVPLHADQAALSAVMEARLKAKGVNASLIWSIDEPAGIGLLDVLPARATKLHAVEFLREQLGLRLEQVVFAGDSGNDLMVLTSEVPAVLVANASPEVKEAASSMARANNNEPALYIARGGFMDMNGNYGAGVLEGLAHYHPHIRAWLLGEGGEE
jgi:sucrose-6F-phosphate phosphohydrolase